MLSIILALLLFIAPLQTAEIDIQIKDVRTGHVLLRNIERTVDVVTLDNDTKWLVKHFSGLQKGSATMGTYVYNTAISCTRYGSATMCTPIKQSCYAIKQNDIIRCVR